MEEKLSKLNGKWENFIGDSIWLEEINLIKDTPLNYAYVMYKSDRVIQKENKELLMEIHQTELLGNKLTK